MLEKNQNLFILIYYNDSKIRDTNINLIIRFPYYYKHNITMN